MKKLFFIFLVFACQVKEPVQTHEPLEYSTPEAEGVSSKGILNFIEAAETQQPDALHSMMIVRHGKIIAEGWWNPYNADSPHLLYSLSKSFTSTAIGFAVQENLLTINDPVISFFPDKTPETPSENLKNMRIRDLLRMTTGHATDSYGRIKDHPDGWVSGFLSLPVEHKPGTLFIYNTGATYMLSAILQKVTGLTLVEFLQPRLFDPLGIKKPFWQSDPEGINLGGTGLYVTTKDIAKLGQLYMQKGNWKGQQMLNESWVNMATSLQASNGSNPESDWDQGYGYQFWRCQHGNYRGDGAFGQYCIVMPELDAVIAITSGSNDMQGILNMVWDNILPAIQDEALATDEASLNALKERLENLALSTISGEEKSPLADELTGKKFKIEANNLGVDAIAFNLTDGEKHLTVWNSIGEQSIPVGFNTILRGAFSFPDQVAWVTAASGAWISDTNYKVKIYNIESPHGITFDFKFDGNTLIWDSEQNVSFGPATLPQLKGKVE